MSGLRTSRRAFLGSSAAALAVFGGGAAPGGKVLRWRFTPGETIRYATTQRATHRVAASENSPATEFASSRSIDLSWKVEAVDAQGVASLIERIDRLRMKSESPRGEVTEFDSASEKDPPTMSQAAAATMRAAVARTLLVKMNSQGAVLERKALPAARGEADKDKSPGKDRSSPSPAQEPPAPMLWRIALPEGPVAPGKTWTEAAATTSPLMGPVTLESRFRYEGSETRDGRTLEKITFSTRMKPRKEQAPKPFQVSQQESEGAYYFDNAAGRMVEMTTKTKLKMSVSESGKKTLEQSNEIEQRFELKPAEAGGPAPQGVTAPIPEVGRRGRRGGNGPSRRLPG